MSDNGQPMQFTHRHLSMIQAIKFNADQALKEIDQMKEVVKQLNNTVNKMIGAMIFASIIMPILTAYLMRKP